MVGGIRCRIARVHSSSSNSNNTRAPGAPNPQSQCAEECVEEEQAGLSRREAHKWKLPWKPAYTPADALARADKVWGGDGAFGGERGFARGRGGREGRKGGRGGKEGMGWEGGRGKFKRTARVLCNRWR